MSNLSDPEVRLRIPRKLRLTPQPLSNLSAVTSHGLADVLEHQKKMNEAAKKWSNDVELSAAFTSAAKLTGLVGKPVKVGRDAVLDRIVIEVEGTRFSLSSDQWFKWEREQGTTGVDKFDRLANKIRQHLQSTAKKDKS